MCNLYSQRKPRDTPKRVTNVGASSTSPTTAQLRWRRISRLHGTGRAPSRGRRPGAGQTKLGLRAPARWLCVQARDQRARRSNPEEQVLAWLFRGAALPRAEPNGVEGTRTICKRHVIGKAGEVHLISGAPAPHRSIPPTLTSGALGRPLVLTSVAWTICAVLTVPGARWKQ